MTLTLSTGTKISRNNLPVALGHVAEGRVWAGREAFQLGLVDGLGGLEDAIALARREAGLNDEAPSVEYPKKGTTMEKILQALNLQKEKDGDGDKNGRGPWCVTDPEMRPSSIEAVLLALLSGESSPLASLAQLEGAAQRDAMASAGECRPMLLAPVIKLD